MVRTDAEGGGAEPPSPSDIEMPSPHRPSVPQVVVIVCPPWPRSGAAWIVKNQVDYYHTRGFEVHLAIVPFHRWFIRDNPVWNEVLDGFKDLGADGTFAAPLDIRRYDRARFAATIFHGLRGTVLDWEIAIATSAEVPEALCALVRSKPVALLHVNYAQTMGFALRLRKMMQRRTPRVPIVLETHDIQSHLLAERKGLNPWKREADPMERLVRTEISWVKKADVLVHLSVDDLTFFRGQLPRTNHVLVMPTINEEFIRQVQNARPLASKIDLLFVGQKHAPNVAALRWFFENVWSLIEHKKYVLKIVGPVAELFKEQCPLLFETYQKYFTGPVEDLSSYYRSARCVIAPMVSGSGTSIKTIEALALSKAIVGTTKAFRGMPLDRVRSAGVEPFDTPQSFAEGIISALENGTELGERSRCAYEELFSTTANIDARDQAMRLVGILQHRTV